MIYILVHLIHPALKILLTGCCLQKALHLHNFPETQRKMAFKGADLPVEIFSSGFLEKIQPLAP